MKKVTAVLLTSILAGTMTGGCGMRSDPVQNAETLEDETTEEAAGENVQEKNRPYEGQEITFAGPGAGDWEKSIEPIIEKFEEYTGAKVNMELYSYGDFLEMLQIKMDSGSDNFDVISVDVPLVASYATRGWISPIDEYFTDEEKAMLTPAALEAGSWDGAFYAPAMNSSSQLLWYNNELLKEAGVEVPESTPENRLTWEQVEEIAGQVLDKVDPDKNKGIAGISFEQVSRTYQMNQIPNSLGGKNIGDDGYTAQGVVNDEAWIKGAEWYQSLFDRGLALKGLSAEDAGSFFNSGKVLFLVGGTWIGYGYTNEDNEGLKDFSYAPVPAFEGYETEVGTPTGSWHFGIPVNAKNKELAAEFIKYMSIGEGNDIWVTEGDQVPATVSGVEKLLDSEDASGYMKIAAYESANTAVPRALTPGYTEYETIINNTWEDIKNGSDVREALDIAAEKIDSAMEKYK